MTYNSLDFLLLAVMAIGGFLAGIEYGAHRQRQRDRHCERLALARRHAERDGHGHHVGGGKHHAVAKRIGLAICDAVADRAAVSGRHSDRTN
jgi:hypothetical protein